MFFFTTYVALSHGSPALSKHKQAGISQNMYRCHGAYETFRFLTQSSTNVGLTPFAVGSAPPKLPPVALAAMLESTASLFRIDFTFSYTICIHWETWIVRKISWPLFIHVFHLKLVHSFTLTLSTFTIKMFKGLRNIFVNPIIIFFFLTQTLFHRTCSSIHPT